MSHCLRCRVRGRVQGVWFRASTQQQAEQLGLVGSAHNMSDGSVEVVACGEETALRSLHEWLWRGSEQAQVEQVLCEGVELKPPLGFTTG